MYIYLKFPLYISYTVVKQNLINLSKKKKKNGLKSMQIFLFSDDSYRK